MADTANRATNGERIERFAAPLARIRVPLGFLCAAAVLYLSRPTPRSLVVGTGIALLGETLRVWAAGHLDKGREVTQSGPYRITRHPLYVGSAIVALGAAVASARTDAAVIIGVYMFITILAAVRHEERNMRSRFGDVYVAYLQSQTAPTPRAFSLDRAFNINKEHKAVMGLFALIAVLAAKAAFG